MNVTPFLFVILSKFSLTDNKKETQFKVFFWFGQFLHMNFDVLSKQTVEPLYMAHETSQGFNEMALLRLTLGFS